MHPAQELEELLSDGEELTIVCHNNPDPDCLASAFALGRIAMGAGIDEHHMLYSGDISHQQNRAFVNLLDIDLKSFEPGAVQNRPEGSLLAFVDHAVPGANNRVPEGTPVDIVIDHHPNEGIEARFIDHREQVGATATILTEYVRELTTQMDSDLGTALQFAIRRETLGFLRGATREEYEAAEWLHEHADSVLLRTLSTPSVTGATVDSIAEAITNRTVRGSVLISGIGRTGERDALPQAADYLATLGASRRRSCSASSTMEFSCPLGRLIHGFTSVMCLTRRFLMSEVPAATERWPGAKCHSLSSQIIRLTTNSCLQSLSRS